MLEPLILSSVGDALRRAGFKTMADLEFSLFGKNWIGDQLNIQGGKKLAVQDQYLDYQERLERLSPMVRAVVKELFNLREPGIRACLALMGFIPKEHAPAKTREKKIAREDMERLMQRAVDPYIPASKEEELPFKYSPPPPRPPRGFRSLRKSL